MPKTAQIESLNLTLKFFHSKKHVGRRFSSPALAPRCPSRQDPQVIWSIWGYNAHPFPNG